MWSWNGHREGSIEFLVDNKICRPVLFPLCTNRYRHKKVSVLKDYLEQNQMDGILFLLLPKPENCYEFAFIVLAGKTPCLAFSIWSTFTLPKRLLQFFSRDNEIRLFLVGGTFSFSIYNSKSRKSKAHAMFHSRSLNQLKNGSHAIRNYCTWSVVLSII